MTKQVRTVNHIDGIDVKLERLIASSESVLPKAGESARFLIFSAVRDGSPILYILRSNEAQDQKREEETQRLHTDQQCKGHDTGTIVSYNQYDKTQIELEQ